MAFIAIQEDAHGVVQLFLTLIWWCLIHAPLATQQRLHYDTERVWVSARRYRIERLPFSDDANRSIGPHLFPPLRYMLSVDNSPIGLLYYCELKARGERNRQLGDSAQTGATYFARHIEKIGQNRPIRIKREREKKACCYHGSLNSMCVCVYTSYWFYVFFFLLFLYSSSRCVLLLSICPLPMSSTNTRSHSALSDEKQQQITK